MKKLVILCLAMMFAVFSFVACKSNTGSRAPAVPAAVKKDKEKTKKTLPEEPVDGGVNESIEEMLSRATPLKDQRMHGCEFIYWGFDNSGVVLLQIVEGEPGALYKSVGPLEMSGMRSYDPPKGKLLMEGIGYSDKDDKKKVSVFGCIKGDDKDRYDYSTLRVSVKENLGGNIDVRYGEKFKIDSNGNLTKC